MSILPHCQTGSCEVPCGDSACYKPVKVRRLYVPEKVIPAHTIYNCRDCEHFEPYGTPYQDGDTCFLDPNNDCRTVYDGIPDWCPLLPENDE
jgi:hypothetical protein